MVVVVPLLLFLLSLCLLPFHFLHLLLHHLLFLLLFLLCGDRVLTFNRRNRFILRLVYRKTLNVKDVFML